MITRELIIQLQEITAPDRVREKEILASHASFRTGGPADLFIQVSDREELQKVMDLLAQAQTDVFLLGRGTNLLIGDGGYRGAVVTMCAPAGTETALSGVRIDGNVIHAGAGASLLKIAMAAKDAGLAGFEFAAGIPGSLAAASRERTELFWRRRSSCSPETGRRSLTGSRSSRSSAETSSRWSLPVRAAHLSGPRDILPAS